MSKIGKKLIILPATVTVQENSGVLEFKSKDHTVTLPILPQVKAVIEGSQLSFQITEPTLQAKANWGTMRALAQNVVIGLTEGFKKTLEILGVGFRATLEGADLVLSVGFSHPVRFTPPAGVKLTIEKNTITITSINKYLVGEVAAKIRAVKKPEPYKGTGIRYKDEVVRKKAGKKVAGATGTATK